MEYQWTTQDSVEPVFSHKNKLASHSSIVSTTRNMQREEKASWTPYLYEESLKCLRFSGGVKAALIFEASCLHTQYTL